MPASIPQDTRVFRFNESFFYPNAHRLKTAIMDAIQTFHAPAYSSVHGTEADRNWSVVGEQRVARLRKRALVQDPSSLPPLGLVVIDFGRVNHTDVTAVTNLRSLFTEVKKYAGKDVEIRFVAMTDYVRQRFERGGWSIVDDAEGLSNAYGDGGDEKAVKLYRDVASAMAAPRRQRTEAEMGMVLEKGKGDDGNVTISHNEKV